MSHSKTTNRVLLLGASTQSAIFVAKQLKLSGLHVSVIDWHQVPVYCSKYVDAYFDFADSNPKNDIAKFSEAVFENIRLYEYDAVIPIHDPAVEFCMKYEAELRKIVVLPGVNQPEAYQYAHDKSKLMMLARKHGIITPQTFVVNNLTDLDQLPQALSFPCVVKPASSSVVYNNRILEFKVCFAESHSRLVDLVREHVLLVPVMIQELVPGYGIGFNVLAENGNVKAAYIHRRLNEKNGVSSYRESVPVDTYGLQQKVEALIADIGWNGVAMIEFKVHEGQAVLMEMNGRFWGSIEVAVRSGLNFPLWLYEMEVKKKSLPQSPSYRLVRVRNLHREAIQNFEQLKKGNWKNFFRWLWSLRQSFSSKDFVEDNVFADPRFVARLYWNDFRRNLQKVFGKRSGAKGAVANFSNNSDHVIAFVCTGNICRSPFAELLAQKLYPEKKFVSFGTVDVSSRLSPVNAVRAAKKLGIELDEFRSTSFRDINLRSIQHFVVMDARNHRELLALGISPHQIFFLDHSEIPDPYMHDEDFFATVYLQIQTAIRDNLFQQ